MKQRLTEQQTEGAPAMYTAGDFARLIKWHAESVRRAVRQGRIKAVRVGSGWRIPAEEVRRICTAGLPLTPQA